MPNISIVILAVLKHVGVSGGQYPPGVIYMGTDYQKGLLEKLADSLFQVSKIFLSFSKPCAPKINCRLSNMLRGLFIYIKMKVLHIRQGLAHTYPITDGERLPRIGRLFKRNGRVTGAVLDGVLTQYPVFRILPSPLAAFNSRQANCIVTHIIPVHSPPDESQPAAFIVHNCVVFGVIINSIFAVRAVHSKLVIQKKPDVSFAFSKIFNSNVSYQNILLVINNVKEG